VLTAAALVAAVFCCIPSRARAAAATSYDTVPLFNDIFAPSWGASPFLSPGELFWQSGTFFTDPRMMSQARRAAHDIDASGRVPLSGAQRWQDTYVQSRPPSVFHSPPGWVRGALAADPPFRAWAEWVDAHREYLDVAQDGGSYPPEYRPWGGMDGNVLPPTPLKPADIVPGMTGATYGDLFAYRWGQLAAKTGAYGVLLSDFSDSIPHGGIDRHGFNPGIIAAFGRYIGHPLPPGPVPEMADAILQQYGGQWADFWCDNWARFMAGIAREVGRQTGHEPLIFEGTGFSTSVERHRAADLRVILKATPSPEIVFNPDTLTMSPERRGLPMVLSTQIVGQMAAYEPDARIGPVLESDDALFWTGVAKHWPELTPADQRRRGLGEVKRLWLEVGWMHIADRAGRVRRGVAFLSRGYWDQGQVPADVLAVMRSHVPARPFGPALYYSNVVARAREVGALASHASEDDAYFATSDGSLADLRDRDGIGLDYFVSDAALPNLRPEARPAAWVVLETQDPRSHAQLVPASELEMLARTAPVLTSLDQLRAAELPLRYGKHTTGIGFFDRHGDLIITVSNLLGTTAVVHVELASLRDGAWTASNLLAHGDVTFTVSGGHASLDLPVEGWDSLALALRPATRGAATPDAQRESR
jgi:hypothetical protein